MTNTLNHKKGISMKKSIVLIALVCVMVFAFASSAMADHAPQFYFNWQQGAGVTNSPTFQAVFPTAAGLTFSIDNGSYALETATPHKGYTQTTAKCGVCHSVHRAPTLGTSSTSAPTTSSRYSLSGYTTNPTVDTQLLLKSTAATACQFCHISSGYHLMYGGDATMAWVTSTDPEYSWNEFYGHASNCVQCHAVHGAYTLPGSKILKYQGVKASSTFQLQVQPEVYNNSPLWASKQDMIDGVLKPAAIADGVTLGDAAVTAHCSICHANYSPDNNTMINNDLTNVQLFQTAAWASANGSVAPWVPGVSAGTWSNTFSMKYKNHPMKNADAIFSSPGATGNATDGSVSITDSYNCQSCHNAPSDQLDGMYFVQMFPHYTPGYYKFMAAQDQSAFDTPATVAEVNLGRIPFFETGIKGPAVMNDGYCVKCHTTVGVDW